MKKRTFGHRFPPRDFLNCGNVKPMSGLSGRVFHRAYDDIEFPWMMVGRKGGDSIG